MPRLKPENLTSEQLISRQINYTVIKEMWCIHNGGKSQTNLYRILDSIPRQAYTRILTNDAKNNPPNLSLRAEIFSKKTGVDVDIFLGKQIFDLGSDFTRENWEGYFKCLYPVHYKWNSIYAESGQWLREIDNPSSVVIDNLINPEIRDALETYRKRTKHLNIRERQTHKERFYTEIETIDIKIQASKEDHEFTDQYKKNIREQLRSIDINSDLSKIDFNLYKFYVFSSTGKVADTVEDLSLTNIIKALGKINLNQLKNMDANKLDLLGKQLTQQLEMVKAIKVLRKHKAL